MSDPCPKCGKQWLNGTCEDTPARRGLCFINNERIDRLREDSARGVHAKLFAECRQENVDLKAELERERVGWKEWRLGYMDTKEENRRLRALVSWIDGRLVDEAPWMEIRAGIDRWREQK